MSEILILYSKLNEIGNPSVEEIERIAAFCSVHPQTENFNNIMSSFELDPSNPKSTEEMGKGDAVAAFLQVRQSTTLKSVLY